MIQRFTSLLRKMEVLSLQNHHIQEQFSVTGTTKATKDWTSSLTTNLQAAPSSITSTIVYSFLHNPIEHLDVVDDFKPQQRTPYFTYSNRRSINCAKHMFSSSLDMETATTTSPKSGLETAAGAHHHYTCNNNLIYCAPNTTSIATNETISNYTPYHHSPLTGIPIAALTPSPVSSSLSTPTKATEHFGIVHVDVDVTVLNELSQRLQAELRAAKSRHLSCTEVSLPGDLTSRIAADVIKTSEREPCGVRGCSIYIDFEEETGSARRIASFKVDPNTFSTFELFLTLKQDKGGWTSLLPQFLKNLTRSSTILISPHFTLHKHKLYTCE